MSKWLFFDLDGTLADSVPIMYQIYLDVLKEFEIEGSAQEFEELNGPSLLEVIALLKLRHRLEVDAKDLLKLYQAKIEKAYKSAVRPIEGAGALLEKLHEEGYSLALVTAAAEEIARGFLQNQSWGEYFNDFVFGEELAKAKPSPEIYRLAFRKAGIRPEEALVLEDSRNGVLSAKGAGAFVVALARNQDEKKLKQAGADAVITRLDQLPEVLEKRA